MEKENIKTSELPELINTAGNTQDILLSICVLSYNQASEIERLLRSLYGQEIDCVEIVVRDDSTNDETFNLIGDFSKDLPIRYFHGEKEGIDKTVIFLLRRAKGKFVWWVGDDEFTPCAISYVIRAIRNNPEVNFIWANYRLGGGARLAVDFNNDRYFEDRNELLECTGAALGFISATVFRRSLALSGIKGAEAYVGSAFVNLYIVLHVISHPGKMFYLRGPIVICHPATSEEIKEVVLKGDGYIQNNAFQVFGINFAEIVREFSASFDAKTIRKTLSISFGQTWRGVLVGSVGGWDTTKGKRLKLIRHFWMFPEVAIAAILFFVPVTILRPMYSVYKCLNMRNKY